MEGPPVQAEAPTQEPAAQPEVDNTIEAEIFEGLDDDSAYAGSSYGSLTESLSSTIARGVKEYGRTYAAYGNEEYGLPIDEEEMDRIDMSHAKYVMLLDKKLFLAPIAKSPQRILDLGTGTGIWAIDMADAFPMAKVLGLDIAPVQPEWVPPNCTFRIDDIEMDWQLEDKNYDFIHARDLLLCIRDWPKLVRQAYEHIRPGGYFELQCVYPKLLCDDDTMTPENGLQIFANHARQATKNIGFPLDDILKYTEFMKTAGFEEVTEVRVKMPSSAWPKDRRLKLIGAFEMQNMVKGVGAMSYRMFSKGFGWSQAETEAFLVEVRRDTANMRFHTYWDFFIVHGRKPGGKAESSAVA